VCWQAKRTGPPLDGSSAPSGCVSASPPPSMRVLRTLRACRGLQAGSDPGVNAYWGAGSRTRGRTLSGDAACFTASVRVGQARGRARGRTPSGGAACFTASVRVGQARGRTLSSGAACFTASIRVGQARGRTRGRTPSGGAACFTASVRVGQARGRTRGRTPSGGAACFTASVRVEMELGGWRVIPPDSWRHAPTAKESPSAAALVSRPRGIQTVISFLDDVRGAGVSRRRPNFPALGPRPPKHPPPIPAVARNACSVPT
jgi:hypothetical protein